MKLTKIAALFKVSTITKNRQKLPPPISREQAKKLDRSFTALQNFYKVDLFTNNLNNIISDILVILDKAYKEPQFAVYLLTTFERLHADYLCGFKDKDRYVKMLHSKVLQKFDRLEEAALFEVKISWRNAAEIRRCINVIRRVTGIQQRNIKFSSLLQSIKEESYQYAFYSFLNSITVENNDNIRKIQEMLSYIDKRPERAPFVLGKFKTWQIGRSYCDELHGPEHYINEQIHIHYLQLVKVANKIMMRTKNYEKFLQAYYCVDILANHIEMKGLINVIKFENVDAYLENQRLVYKVNFGIDLQNSRQLKAI